MYDMCLYWVFVCKYVLCWYIALLRKFWGYEIKLNNYNFLNWELF